MVKGKSLTNSNEIIYESKDLTIELEWRGKETKVFSFDANGLFLRVRFEDGTLSVIFNQGDIEMPNDEAHPIVLSLSKRRQRQN